LVWCLSRSCPRKQPRAEIGQRSPPVEHETALIDIFLLWVNSRQAVFASKLDDALSFGEIGASGGRHNRAHLLLRCGVKRRSLNLWRRVEFRSLPILASVP